MHLIIGLGNPGKKYANTRHNLGFLAIDELLEKFGASLKKHGDLYESARIEISGQKAVLARPLTFMNKSGEAVQYLVRRKAVPLEKMLIICDDLNLPVGKLRLRVRGSAGGHNGLTSIIEHLGSQDFTRLRIGIGRPDNNTAWEKFVLEPFLSEEKEIIKNSLKSIPEIIETFVLNSSSQ